MLRDIFLKIFNMSITASFVIVLIILIRLVLLKKMPKLFSYALWGIVLLRLLLPFSISSSFSLFNFIDVPVQADMQITDYVPSNSNVDVLEMPQTNTGINIGIQTGNDAFGSVLPAVTPQHSVNTMQMFIYIASWVWMGTGALTLIYYAVSCLLIKMKLKTAVFYCENVFLSDRVRSPIVFGFFKPRIILPADIEKICSAEEINHITAHENVHIKRFDHITKMLSVIVLAVYWYNPLIWLAFILSNKDRELACDERVMKLASSDIRAEYASSLVKIGTHKQSYIGSLAFGESNIKSRVKSVVNFKKSALWVSLTAVAAIIVIAVVCLTNAVDVNKKIDGYLDIIVNESSVAFSSNPYDYINANKEVFDKITALSEDGLSSMLKMFEDSEDNGLREYVMAVACNTIKPIMTDDDFESGRDWYIKYKKDEMNGGKTELLAEDKSDYKTDAEDIDEVSIDAYELFKQYGWTLDYKIGTKNEKINQMSILSDFEPNTYYFAYNNELSKDIGLDMSEYCGMNLTVEIYRIREEMPPKSNPNKDARGIVVKNGNQIIGAYISAGRHSAFSACSLKGNFFEAAAGMSLEEWLAKRLVAGKYETQTEINDPEQVIATYFLALSEKNEELAKSCMAKTSMTDSLTINMANDELYNKAVNIMFMNADLKAVELIEVKQTDSLGVCGVIFNVEYGNEYINDGTIESGEQWWLCYMVYESPQTGWKIKEFGH